MLTATDAASLEGLFGIFSNWPGKKHAERVQRFKARTGKPWMKAQSLDVYGQIMACREALERAGVDNARRVAGLVVAQWQGGHPLRSVRRKRRQAKSNGRANKA